MFQRKCNNNLLNNLNKISLFVKLLILSNNKVIILFILKKNKYKILTECIFMVY